MNQSMPLDPMSQYDPATEALITQQNAPQQRVSQALMAQRSPLQDVNGTLQNMMQMYQMKKMFGTPPTAGGAGTIPVTTPGLETNFNNFGMGGGT